MITAASIDQVNDSLWFTNVDTKKVSKKGSLAEKVEKLLKNKDEITITIESAGIELGKDDKNVLTVPSKDEFKVNLIFTSTFKKTNGKELGIIDNNNLDELNITLPNGDFGKLKVTTDYSTALVKSAGETDVEFTAIINKKVGSLTLGKGLNVVANGHSSVAEGATYKKDGATVDVVVFYSGTQKVAAAGADTKISGTKVKEVIIAGTVTLNADSKLDDVKGSPLTTVTIKEGGNLTLNTAAKEIIGSLDKDGKIAATVTTSTDPFAYVESINDAVVTGSGTLDVPAAKFDNVKFEKFTTYNYSKDVDTATGVEFNESLVQFDVPTKTDDAYTFTFDGVKFAQGTTFNVKKYWNADKLKDAAGEDVVVKYYYWINGSANNLPKGTYKGDDTTDDNWKLYNDTITTTINESNYDNSKWSSIYDKDKTERDDSIKNAAALLAASKEPANEMARYHIGYEKGWGAVKAYREEIVYTKNETTVGGKKYLVPEHQVKSETKDGKTTVTVLVFKKRYYLADTDVKYGKSYNEIPAWIKKDYTTPGNLYCEFSEKSDEETNYANFTVIIAFDGCTYGKEDLSANNIKVVKPNDEPVTGSGVKVKVRYDIDGKLYEPRMTDTTNKWFLYER